MRNDNIRLILGEEQLAMLAGGGIPALPKVEPHFDTDREKIIGGFLGLAAGDALGWPYEGMKTEDIMREQPDVVYLERRKFGAEPIGKGEVSDDTLMSLDVARCLADRGCIDPDYQLSLHESYKIRGAGSVVLKALHFHRFGVPWHQCGLDIPYNGGAMRALPVGVFFHDDLDGLVANAILSCYVTHVNADAIAATVVMAYAAAYVYRLAPQAMRSDMGKRELIRNLGTVAGRIEQALEGRGEAKTAEKRLSSLLLAMPELLGEFTGSPLKALHTIGNSVDATESAASALFLFLRTPEDYREITVTAVRGGNDCDSVASMAGGLCGLLCGPGCIPRQLREGMKDLRQVEDAANGLIRRMEASRVAGHTDNEGR